ncbi:hypothetical protein D3C73_1335430 [compost metagenome]
MLLQQTDRPRDDRNIKAEQDASKRRNDRYQRNKKHIGLLHLKSIRLRDLFIDNNSHFC